MLPSIPESSIVRAASEGMDAFVDLFVQATLDTIGGELNAETMPSLTAEQVTLLAYHTFREEVMDGGFVQLIHNGYGPFIFLNPFAKAMRLWGQELSASETGDCPPSEPDVLHDFQKLIYRGRKLFERYGEELTRPCSDEEFMALFEQYPDFDDLDDTFIENEEDITAAIARYIDNHINLFANILIL